MTTKTEDRHAAEFILSEANGQRSRENVTLLANETLKAGEVLGQIAQSESVVANRGKYASASSTAPAGQAGANTGVAISIYPVEASTSDQQIAVIHRDSEVNGELLEYDSTVTTDAQRSAKNDDLADVGIIVR